MDKPTATPEQKNCPPITAVDTKKENRPPIVVIDTKQENRPPVPKLVEQASTAKLQAKQDVVKQDVVKQDVVKQDIVKQDTVKGDIAEQADLGQAKGITKPKHRRVIGLRLTANAKPASEDWQRRFTLRVTPPDPDAEERISPGVVSKIRPRLITSDRLFEWRAFELERTPAAILNLQEEAIPFQNLEHFLTTIYEAMADGPDVCEDVYMIWSNVTRTTVHIQLDRARKDGTIPKASRFTHFIPSNLLIIKLPVDCHSSAGYLDLITKPIIAWAYSLGRGRELKLCGNTRYLARVPDSCAECLDPDFNHPALRKIAAANPGIIDGFGSFNECDAGFRPVRARPYKFDTPSVVVESSYGADYATLRYKACWWLQLMGGQVKAVILINVDPEKQEIVVENWRNEKSGFFDEGEGPTRCQKVVVTKKDEFKGVAEAGLAEHYRVQGGPLVVLYQDMWLTPPKEERDRNLVLDDDTLAQEAADLWFGDGELANDWAKELGLSGV